MNRFIIKEGNDFKVAREELNDKFSRVIDRVNNFKKIVCVIGLSNKPPIVQIIEAQIAYRSMLTDVAIIKSQPYPKLNNTIKNIEGERLAVINEINENEQLDRR